MTDVLLRFKPFRPQKFRQQGENSLVSQEHSILFQKSSPLFKAFEFASEFFNTDYSSNEFDVMRFEQSFVLLLRVLRNETYGRNAWVNERMLEWSVSAQFNHVA
jgi:hypothetical protein